MSATTRHPQYDDALPGYAAFKRSDGKDAKRRRPESDLRGYGEERSLQFIDTLTPAGYEGVVPGDSRLQFNVLRGELPGGQHGIVYHEPFQWPVTNGDPDGGASLWNVHYMPKLRRPKLRDALMFVPVVGHFTGNDGSGGDERPNAVGVPTTVGACHVPEAATLPWFHIDNTSKPLIMGAHRIKLSEHGLPGMDLITPDVPDEEFVGRLLTSHIVEVIERYHARAFCRIRFDHGQLWIRVDGYLDDPYDLDVLGESVGQAASGLRHAVAPRHLPRPFTELLPTVDWPDDPMAVSESGRFPAFQWLPALHAYARDRNCTLEDPVAYHHAFPSLPVPGKAFIVMRFTPHGTDAIARLAWHAERDINTHNIGRNAVLLPAAPGAAETPRTGVRIQERQLNYSVCDGVLSVWNRRSSTERGDLGDMDGLVEQALALGRELNLAAV